MNIRNYHANLELMSNHFKLVMGDMLTGYFFEGLIWKLWAPNKKIIATDTSTSHQNEGQEIIVNKNEKRNKKRDSSWPNFLKVFIRQNKIH